MRNVWGGPPGAGGRRGRNTNMELPKAAQGLAFAPRGKVQLATFIREDSAELDVKATPPAAGDPPLGVVVPPATHTCGCNLVPSPGAASFAAVLVPLGALLARRRRR